MKRKKFSCTGSAPLSLPICNAPMMPAKNAAHDEQHTSLIRLLKAVQVAHKIEEAPGRRGSRHGTSDSQHLVVNDHALAQSRFKLRGFFEQRTVSCCDKDRNDASRESLWSRASTLPGVGFRLTNRWHEAATIENGKVALVSARSVHRAATVAIELPSVSLPFLHSARRDASPTPEDCSESPRRDDWFHGRNRSIGDLVDMVAWLDK